MVRIAGANTPIMVKGDLVLTLPNPHRKEVGVDLLTRILRQANIDKERGWKLIEIVLTRHPFGRVIELMRNF